MAAPAAVVAAKAVLATAADKRTRTVVLSVAAALLVPFILIMTVILCTLSGAADHNTSAVNTAFHGGYLSSKVPAEYRMYIVKMQDSFLNLDQAVAEINDMAEDETLDADQVKSVFYSLFFGADQPRMGMEEYRKFADCFVTYEEREDEEGDSYTVAVPVHDLQTVYANLSSVFGISAAMETQVNANRIYTLVKYGQALPGGNGMLPGEAMGDGSFAALMAEATKYIGWSYVWGGSSPATSFDCSGYICWVYTNLGPFDSRDILRVEDCVTATPWDADGDGIDELVVRTRWPEKPYSVYDMVDGEVQAVSWPDTVPEEIRENLTCIWEQ